jgi:hypothetical protein
MTPGNSTREIVVFLGPKKTTISLVEFPGVILPAFEPALQALQSMKVARILHEAAEIECKARLGSIQCRSHVGYVEIVVDPWNIQPWMVRRLAH